ncbi:MAG: ABC transporter substrate-binding protein, partial [Candidatus Rokuibacteriota bacterium]
MTSRPLSFIARPAAALLLLLAAVTPVAAAEPIRIGFLAPLSGLFAQAGKDMLDGMRLGLEEADFQAGGRKIELIAEDDESS